MIFYNETIMSEFFFDFDFVVVFVVLFVATNLIFQFEITFTVLN